MKPNTIFYTLLITLFSLTLFSCDENNEELAIDEMSNREDDSISQGIDYRADIDEDDPVESLPDSTFQGVQRNDVTVFIMDFHEDKAVDLTK